MAATKAFFVAVFAWTFTDYSEDYTAFSDEGLDGGFYKASKASLIENGGALLIFYSDDLKVTRDSIVFNNGSINQEIFKFPGGYRFHFIEPSGNEFAVWSEISS